jgi:hypothetical protein
MLYNKPHIKEKIEFVKKYYNQLKGEGLITYSQITYDQLPIGE